MCFRNSFEHSFKSARLQDSRDFKSVCVQVNQVNEFSLQNSLHQLTFTVALSCIKYNGEPQHEKWISFVLFHYYLCISNGIRFPVLLLLSTTCFIKEQIKNLKCKTACKFSCNFLLASWFLCVRTSPIVSHYHFCGNLKSLCKLTDIKNLINENSKQL